MSWLMRRLFQDQTAAPLPFHLPAVPACCHTAFPARRLLRWYRWLPLPPYTSAHRVYLDSYCTYGVGQQQGQQVGYECSVGYENEPLRNIAIMSHYHNEPPYLLSLQRQTLLLHSSVGFPSLPPLDDEGISASQTCYGYDDKHRRRNRGNQCALTWFRNRLHGSRHEQAIDEWTRSVQPSPLVM